VVALAAAGSETGANTQTDPPGASTGPPGAETGIYNCLVVVIIMLTSCYSNGPTARIAVAAQIILSYPPVGATLIYCIVPSSEPAL